MNYGYLDMLGMDVCKGEPITLESALEASLKSEDADEFKESVPSEDDATFIDLAAVEVCAKKTDDDEKESVPSEDDATFIDLAAVEVCAKKTDDDEKASLKSEDADEFKESVPSEDDATFIDLAAVEVCAKKTDDDEKAETVSVQSEHQGQEGMQLTDLDTRLQDVKVATPRIEESFPTDQKHATLIDEPIENDKVGCVELHYDKENDEAVQKRRNKKKKRAARQDHVLPKSGLEHVNYGRSTYTGNHKTNHPSAAGGVGKDFLPQSRGNKNTSSPNASMPMLLGRVKPEPKEWMQWGAWTGYPKKEWMQWGAWTGYPKKEWMQWGAWTGYPKKERAQLGAWTGYPKKERAQWGAWTGYPKKVWVVKQRSDGPC